MISMNVLFQILQPRDSPPSAVDGLGLGLVTIPMRSEVDLVEQLVAR
jgi:hypothetical protein